MLIVPYAGISAQMANYMDIYATTGKHFSYTIDNIRKIIFPSINDMSVIFNSGNNTSHSIDSIRKITFSSSPLLDKIVTQDETIEVDEAYRNVIIAPGENKLITLDIKNNTLTAETLIIYVDENGNAPQVHISEGGKLKANNIEIVTQIKRGYWTMLSLPFDAPINQVSVDAELAQIDSNIKILIYDGAYRANNSIEGFTVSGFKEKREGTISANTGFAVAINSQVIKDTQEVIFRGTDFSMDGTDKEVVLNRYESSVNKGMDADWNFIGNPTLCNKIKDQGYVLYLYNRESDTYTEYSSSQEVTLSPFSAWFVQSSDDFISMSFATCPKAFKGANYNIEGVLSLNFNSEDDVTIVINSDAQSEYKRNEDALYMPSPNANLSQLYIIDKGIEMAVSEQPLKNTTIDIGYKATKSGGQTLTLTNEPDNVEVILTDKLTGIITPMSLGDSYNFESSIGTYKNRFVITMTELTDIETIEQTESIRAVVSKEYIVLYGTTEGEEVAIYNVGGQILSTAVAEEGVTTIPTTITGVLMIKVGEEIIKVVK